MGDSLNLEEWDALRRACSQIVNAPMLTLQRLAEAETTIGALKHLIGEQADENAELRADLWWAVLNGAANGYDGCSNPVIWHATKDSMRTRGGSPVTDVRYDGTPSDMLRVIRAARKGE